MQTGPLVQSPRLSRVAGANQSRAATRETLTAWAILNSPRGQAKKALASGIPSQNELVKEELHNQMVRMRDAFIRIDPRLEGCISRHMVGCTLKAGGMELTKEQLNDALVRDHNAQRGSPLIDCPCPRISHDATTPDPT
jgi:hypothetical protein